MTTIKLKVIDENIEFTSSPPIYSGDVNTISTLFDFGDIWEGFTKTAVFYREIAKPYQIVLKDNECLIPHEVMMTAGRIYIGVFGVKDDKVKTSEVVFYDIGTGVMTFGSISEPSDEIWEQILAELGNIRELAEQMKLDQEAFKTDVAKRQENFETKITKIQSDFETTITNKQNNFEISITERQDEFEQRVENKTGYTREEADERFIPTALQGTFKTDLAEEYKGVASDYGADILKIEGKSEQITTTGANILNTDIYNEFIEFSATKGTYLTLMTNGVPSNGGNIKFVCTDDSEEWFAIDEGKNRVYRAIQKDVKGFYNLLAPKDGLKYMFAVGDIKTYEPFTGGEPSPNPNYPQEIRNALDEPLVSVGRNFANPKKAIPNGSTSINGVSFKPNDDGTITLNGTASNLIDIYYGNNDKATLNLPNGIYLLWNNLKLENYFRITGNIYIKDKTEVTNNNKIHTPFVRIPKGKTFNNDILEVMFERSEEKTKFTPFRYAETNLNFQRMCSLPNGTCDTYENGISTQRIALYGFSGHSREDWKIDKTYTDCTRFYIVKNDIKRRNDYTNSILCNRLKTLPSHTTKDKGISSYTNSDYPNQNWIYVNGFNEFTTVEQFKEWLGTHPINIQYELETPIVLEVEKPIVPTFYPYTNIFQSDDVKAKIQYGLRSKADDIAEELKEHENEINTKLNSYKVKGDFVVINDNINLTNGEGSVDVNYPSGFNKDNCVCIAAGFAYQTAIGYIYDGYMDGGFEVRFKTDRMTCIAYTGGQGAGPSGAKPIRIVLMKV